MAQRSAKVRAKQALEKKQSLLVQALAAEPSREVLADEAFACASDLIRRVRRNEITARYHSGVASLVKALVEVARLEMGEHTSAHTSVRFVVDDDARREKLAQLRAELEASPLIDAQSVARVTDGVTQQVSEPGTTPSP